VVSSDAGLVHTVVVDFRLLVLVWFQLFCHMWMGREQNWMVGGFGLFHLFYVQFRDD